MFSGDIRQVAWNVLGEFSDCDLSFLKNFVRKILNDQL